MRTALLAIPWVFLCSGVAWADRATEEKLATSLRGLLIDSLPTPLYQDARHWDRKAKNLRGKMVNDGRWWKLRVDAAGLPASAQVDVRDLRSAGKNRQTFTLLLHLEARPELERQTWVNGVRLYSGRTRGRVKLHLTMDCEIVTRIETPEGKLLPDVVIRFRVIRSDFRHEGLVIEHTAGVGGDAARTIGDVMLAIIKQVKPSLEQKLLDRVNAAILKAGDSREVRISLSKKK